MTTLDLAALRSLIAAATPGPWTQGHNPPDREPVEYMAAARAMCPKCLREHHACAGAA